jgi:hypothetical protein
MDMPWVLTAVLLLLAAAIVFGPAVERWIDRRWPPVA